MTVHGCCHTGLLLALTNYSGTTLNYQGIYAAMLRLSPLTGVSAIFRDDSSRNRLKNRPKALLTLDSKSAI